MSAATDARAALTAALKAVDGVRHYPDLGASVSPPATLLGLPALEWETYCLDPTSARFVAWLVVDFGERAMEQLDELVVSAAAALDGVENATVARADPATFPTGTQDLPAYQLTVDYSLGG